MTYRLDINYIFNAFFARFLLYLTVTVINKIFITKKNPSVIKTEGDSKGINIARVMLIHFYGIVLTNCAMSLMLNIMSCFIYGYKYLIVIKPNIFIMVFEPLEVDLFIRFSLLLNKVTGYQ